MDQVQATDLAEFYHCNDGVETRYYPATMRNEAMAFDPKAHKLKGHGAYDTAVSTIYAVELYPTKKQAEAHPPVVSEKAPVSALDDVYDQNAGRDIDPEDDEDGEDEVKPKKRKKPATRSDK